MNVLVINLIMFLVISGLQAQSVISSKSTSISVDYSQNSKGQPTEGLGVTGIPKFHALIIGVSNYKYANPELINLDEPVKDALRIRNILNTHYVFDPENITVLQDPSREEIIDEFDRLISTVKPRDNLLVFYAGHGYYDNVSDFGYWLPADAKSTSRANWIANSTIKDYVTSIPAKHTLLITDACFGGSIFKTRAMTSAAIEAKVAELYRDKSRKAMTSGNLSEVPDKSFFIDILLKVLDDNQQVYLPASSLFTRLYEPVMNNSPTVPQFGVIQGAGDEGGDFIFIKRQ